MVRGLGGAGSGTGGALAGVVGLRRSLRVFAVRSVLLGSRGWVGSEAGNVGPAAGVGAFWHLDDNWSLRFDAGATLCLGGGVEMRYTLAAGVQYGF